MNLQFVLYDGPTVIAKEDHTVILTHSEVAEWLTGSKHFGISRVWEQRILPAFKKADMVQVVSHDTLGLRKPVEILSMRHNTGRLPMNTVRREIVSVLLDRGAA